MSVFQTVTPSMQKLDPLKRVNYTFGLVLGVDEFLQEQTYLMEKDHSQYRLAHGYGTVCGLHVGIGDGVNLEVQVSPGVAINPQGQEIRVRKQMCARLNNWLANNKDGLQKIFGPPPFPLSMCVVLCYRECPSDMVPVPGEPCRTQQDTMAAAHITESFELKLCLDRNGLVTSPAFGSPSIDVSTLPESFCVRPSQVEEDTIREFGKLLHRIRITDAAPGFVTQQELEDLVRRLGQAQGSPPVFSPPGEGTLYLHPDDACDFLRAALLVWVTEVRPTLAASPPSSDCDPPSEQCVLLAELNFQVDATWHVNGSVGIDEARRPYLVQSRLLQEMLLCGGVGSGIAELGQAPLTVAAGTFSIDNINKKIAAAGPTYNELTAKMGVNPGTCLLQWSGAPGYVSPLSGPPDARTYVVNGMPMTDPAAKYRVTFEVLGFLGDGIMVRLLDTQGNATATGFMVEIKEITAPAV